MVMMVVIIVDYVDTWEGGRSGERELGSSLR